MEEENGLTLGEIFKVIFKRIWWVVGAAALGVLLVVLVTQLWYNKTKQYYSVTYEIVYPNSQSGRYPNGNEFLISDSISSETLAEIKAGKYSEDVGEFANVDVDKMLKNDAIRLSTKLMKREDDSVATSFTLTVMAQYFSGEEQAVNFLKTVASYPVNRVNAIIAERQYWLNLTTYENALTYTDKISALIAQKNYLSGSYLALREYDNQLDVKIAELNNLFTSEQQQTLNDRLKTNFYVLNTNEYVSNAEYRKAVLKKSIDDNDKIIEALKLERDEAVKAQNAGQSASGFAGSVYDEVVTNPYDVRIADLTAANTSLRNTIADIDNTLAEIAKYTQEGTPEYTEKNNFDGMLEKYRAELTAATEELAEITTKLYFENSRIIFAGNKVERLGGIGAILSAVVGLLVGAILSAIVVCIIDLPKYRRAKLAAQGATAEVAGNVSESADGDNNIAPEVTDGEDKA